MSQHAHKHTRQRKSSILNTTTTTTTTTSSDTLALSKHPSLHVPSTRVRTPHSRFTLPFLNIPGSRITRKALPTVSLTHANVNVNAAAASCINIDIITIDCNRHPKQPQYDYNDYLTSVNVHDHHLQLQCQSQTINIIPFPSSDSASAGEADWVGLRERDLNVDVKIPSDHSPTIASHNSHQRLRPYFHPRTPRCAVTTSKSKSKSGGKSRSRTSKAKHVRAYAGTSSSPSRKSHKRLAADIQFLETMHRSVASHRAQRCDGNAHKVSDVDSVMNAQEGLLLQRLSDLLIELGHRVPPELSRSESISQLSPPSAGRETEDDMRVESTSPDDRSPPSLPTPPSLSRSLSLHPPPPPPAHPTLTLALPSCPPGLSLLARTRPPSISPIPVASPRPTVSAPLSSPPLPPVAMVRPVLSMPQVVAALVLRRRERGSGNADGGRREKEYGKRVGKSSLRVEVVGEEQAGEV